MNKNTIKVNYIASFEFWIGCFKPRTKKWQRENLRRLKGMNEPFTGTVEDHQDKIKALQFLLNS